jgi:hypothetical protein
MVRNWFIIGSVLILTGILLLAMAWQNVLWSLVVVGPLVLLGIYDSLQRRHTVLRNFPVIGHLRYFLEMVRPEIQQYFVENNIDAFPIEREFRSIVYQPAKGELDTRPFGTQRDVYRVDDLRVRHFGELYDFLEPGQLVENRHVPEACVMNGA